MDNAFLQVLCNKDLFKQIQKYVKGNSYKNNPQRVVNILINMNATINKFESFRNILTHIKFGHIIKLIEQDNIDVYKNISDNYHMIYFEKAIQTSAIKILKYMISKNYITKIMVMQEAFNEPNYSIFYYFTSDKYDVIDELHNRYTITIDQKFHATYKSSTSRDNMFIKIPYDVKHFVNNFYKKLI